jgi:hypothetical protein
MRTIEKMETQKKAELQLMEIQDLIMQQKYEAGIERWKVIKTTGGDIKLYDVVDLELEVVNGIAIFQSSEEILFAFTVEQLDEMMIENSGARLLISLVLTDSTSIEIETVM